MTNEPSATNIKPSRVLIGYDGSEEAKRAARLAGALVPDGLAVVLHVFSSMAPWLGVPAAPGPIPPPVDLEAEASRIERHANELAREGADLAEAAGLRATPTVVDAPGTSGAWSTIVRLAEEHDVDLIVVGSRGRSGLKAALLGSVSNGVMHHAARPVLVVPHHAD